jgi:hypothetical protein
MQLSSSGFGDSDIDVFFHGLTPKEAKLKLRGLLKQLAANADRPCDDAVLHGYCSSDEEACGDDPSCWDGEQEYLKYDEHVSAGRRLFRVAWPRAVHCSMILHGYCLSHEKCMVTIHPVMTQKKNTAGSRNM